MLASHTKEHIIRLQKGVSKVSLVRAFVTTTYAHVFVLMISVFMAHNDKEANGYNNNINGPDDGDDDARLSG